MPADPGTVLFFLTDCPPPRPPSGGGLRPSITITPRLVMRGRGVGRGPGRARPTGPGRIAGRGMSEEVAAALRGLPSHGWARGMFGRRDRCLLVLSQLAGVPYKHLAALTAGDITLTAGTATISANAGTWTLLPGDDALLCGSCAVVRWLRVLDLVVTRPGKRDLAKALKKAKAVTGGSAHLCRSTRGMDAATMIVPLLPPIDQWGYIPFSVQRLTPHSLSRRVRDLLAGDLGARRDLPVDTDEAPATPAKAPPLVPRAEYKREDAQRACAPPRRPGRHRRR